MYRRFNRSSRSTRETFQGQHRFEHWYLDHQVYFITSCCRDHFHAFNSEEAKQVFWDRFEHYSKEFGFDPWVVSLMSNHYHVLGYLHTGIKLKLLMQRVHGSVAKLVNDQLPEQQQDFWRDAKGEEYFDGCIRDEKQYRAAYRYTREQARRHRIMYDFHQYPHTQVYVPLEQGLEIARERQAFLQGVGYKRYGT